jgi:tol-pal system protein YbgF
MRFTRQAILALALAPALFGANKEMVQLQRDVALLQDDVRTLQRSLDEKMSALRTLVEQTYSATGKAGTSIAVLESGIRDRMAEQQKTLAGPVANMGAKIDTMSTEFQTLRESISDLSERMNKMQLQMVDLMNTVKVLSAPPAPPPAVGSPSASSGPGGPPPGMSAQGLYDSARKDLSGGNLDLAAQGFQEYLRFYGNTELAPNAQFYIGQIHYDKNEFAPALQAFDIVLEKYPENNKTADATYMKGMALLKSGQRNEAAREFLNVVQKYPSAEVAAKARTQRKALGLTTPAAAPPAAARRRK